MADERSPPAGQVSPAVDGPRAVHESVDRTADGAVIYDSSIIGAVSAKTFSAAAWKTVRPVDNVLQSGGRGYTLIIGDGVNEYVLRHYRRGGLIGRVVRDSYVWTGEDATRSFAEWRVLQKLKHLGLAVPQPAVARYCKRGVLYTADIITVRIPDIQPLSVRLISGVGGAEFWANLGRVVCQFHDEGVDHADLSSHNIQIDDSGKVWLLDFDQAKLRPQGPWRQKNLGRLHRSLQKIKRLNSGVRYQASDWNDFLEGYFQGSKSS